VLADEINQQVCKFALWTFLLLSFQELFSYLGFG